MLKKFAVVVLAVAMLMSYMGLASAAVFTDTAGHKQEAAIDRLTALELLKGYPDGTFKPEAPITRAEFATVIVRALGLEAAAQMMAGTPTVFSDVYAGHWATGYINVAASQGIVNGYPDGTFQPNNNVTYAEALKMILCALGYKPEVFRTVVWPVTWVAKAMELGITGGVALATGAASLPATRADIARLVDNALTVDKLVQKGYGDEITYEVKAGETLLKDLGCTEIEGVVTEAGFLLGSDLDDDEVTVDPPGEDDPVTYQVAGGIDPKAIVGLDIEGWVADVDDDGADELIVLSDSNAGDVTEGVIDGNAADLATVTIDDEEYTLADGAVVFVNWQVADVDAIDLDELAGYKAKYILNEDDEVVMLFANDWEGFQVVAEVDTKHKIISTSEGDIDLDDDFDSYTIERNGAAAKLEDLKENDLLWIWEAGGEAYLMAYSNTVTGTLKKAATDWSSITVESKSYDVGDNALYSTDGGDTLEDTASSDLLGEKVTLYLDPFGDARVVVGDLVAEAAEEIYALLYDVKTVSGLSDVTYLRVYGPDGEKHDYAVTEDSELTNVAGAVYTGEEFMGLANDGVREEWLATGGLDIDEQIATITLTDDGKVDTVVLEASPDVIKDTDVSAADDVSDDKDRIRLGSLWYAVADNVVIYDNIEEDGNVVKWAAIEGASGTLKVLAKVDAGEVVALVIRSDTAGTLATEEVTGLVVGKALTADGDEITLDVEGALKAYTLADDASVTALVYSNDSTGGSGDYDVVDVGDWVEVRLDASGDVAAITEPDATDPDVGAVGVVADVSRTSYKVKIGSTYYYGSAETQVYDCTDPDNPENVGWGGVSKNDEVQLFLDDDGFITCIKVTGP